MTDRLASDAAQRTENILRRVDLFKPISTRRTFMSRLLAAGGGAAVGLELRQRGRGRGADRHRLLCQRSRVPD